jgi:tetratricopeptide (TPR) repeat protein
MMRLIFLPLCLFAFFSFIACNDSNPATGDDPLLQQAPYRELSDSIRQQPRKGHLYAQRGELLWKNGLTNPALKDAIQAWQLEPNEDHGDLLCAIAGMAQLQDSLLPYLTDINRRFPRNIFFRNQLAEGYAARGNYRQALAHNDTILAADTINAVPWLNRGKYFALLQDTAQAIAALEKCNAVAGRLFVTGELANLYALTGHKKTIAFCDQLLQADSTGRNGEALYYKGIYYTSTKQPAQALRQFDECIKRDYTLKEAYIEKGALLYDQQQYDNALQTFQTLQKIFNTFPDAYYWMGKCQEAKNNKSDAVLNYQKCIALDKNFTEAAEGLKRLGGTMPK